MRRHEVALAALLTLLLVIGGGLVYVHDDPQPYTAAKALEDFRAQGGGETQPSAAAGRSPGVQVARSAAPVTADRAKPGSAQPRATGTDRSSPAPSASKRPDVAPDVEPGVYGYTTQGFEEIDALGGARHDYPTDSAITYRRGGCGTVDRWEPLEGRVSTNTLCRGARGIEPRRSVQRREFYHQSETQDLSCSAGLALVPTRPVPGSVQRGECRSDDTLLRLDVRIIDADPLVVGGERTDAVHLRVTGTLTGSTRGSTDREEWFTPGGLLLRVTAVSDTDRDTAGGVVHYRESYRLALRSLRPQR